MKKLIGFFTVLTLSLTALAQGGNTGMGGNEESHIFLNYQGVFQADDAAESWKGSFQNRHLRLEMKGTFGEHLFYRLRHQLNMGSTAQSLDHFARATDLMFVGWKFNDRHSLIAGKVCQSWGGFEYDENPVFIYQYCDFLNAMDIFMAGVTYIWTPVPGQEFQFQVTNSYNGYENYPFPFPEAAFPLSGIVNWNGSLFEGLVTTRWAAGFQTQAQDRYSKMLTLGTKLNLKNFQAYLDYMGAWDDVDRLGYLTAETGSLATQVAYHTLTGKADWQFAPQWNGFLAGMLDTGFITHGSGKRTAAGGYAGIEYHPFPGKDIRVFLLGSRRGHRFQDPDAGIRTKRVANSTLELGLIFRLKAF